MRAALVVVLTLPSCGRGFEVHALPMDEEFGVRAVVNDRRAHLSVDTGAMAGVFFDDRVKKLGLHVQSVEGRSVTILDSSGVGRTVGDFACDVDVALGDAVFTLDYFACLPRTPQCVTDGMIGMTIMQHCVLWFDAPGGELHVMSAGTAEAFVARRGLTVAHKLPLLREPLHPHVRVRLQDRVDVELLLDTGAAVTSVPTGTVNELQLAKQPWQTQHTEPDGTIVIEVGKHDGRSVGVHGVWTDRRQVYQLPLLQIGDQSVRDLKVVEEDEAELGRDVLAKFDWILHGPRRELWLLTPR